jgi:diacylglycerol kinase (ATP)
LRLLIIFNPNAASGRSAKKLAEIAARMQSSGIHASIKLTNHPGHGSELVASTDLTAYDGVVAAGGDGTLFEVLNGLYQHQKPDRVPLGLLPIGTGNAFARDLGLQPFDWPAAIDILVKGRTCLVDVGYVQCADTEYHFLNVTHMGFPVDAGRTAKNLKFIGNTAYTIGTLWQALKLKSYPLVIELDGEEIRQDNIFVTISNTQYTGTHFLIAPGAVIDDGLLDVILLQKLPRHRLLRLFPTIYHGGHIEQTEVTVHKVSQINLRSPAGMLLAPDGEFQGRTPARITCLHQDLTIFA